MLKKISSIVVVSMNYFSFWRKHNRTNLPYKGSFGILCMLRNTFEFEQLLTQKHIPAWW